MMALRVLRLGNGGRLEIWRVIANVLNKHPRIADKGWPSNLGVGRGANKFSP
jgi:hypothetical protein